MEATMKGATSGPLVSEMVFDCVPPPKKTEHGALTYSFAHHIRCHYLLALEWRIAIWRVWWTRASDGSERQYYQGQFCL